MSVKRGDVVVALKTELAAALQDDALMTQIVPVLHPRARRVSLRVDPTAGTIVLVWPRGMSARSAARFVAGKRNWITRRLAALPTRVPFQDGATVPFLGEDHVIKHVAGSRGGVWRESGVIYVTGREEHVARRVVDWLKAEARRILGPMVLAMAGVLGRQPARISVRDTRSRWGSCSADGKLSFCWRLIFAPEWVLAYVAAHEVAHLRHLNHSRAFWRTLGDVLTAYSKDGEPAEAASAREWLRRCGAALHCYG